MGESINVQSGDRYEAAELVQEGDLAVQATSVRH